MNSNCLTQDHAVQTILCPSNQSTNGFFPQSSHILPPGEHTNLVASKDATYAPHSARLIQSTAFKNASEAFVKSHLTIQFKKNQVTPEYGLGFYRNAILKLSAQVSIWMNHVWIVCLLLFSGLKNILKGTGHISLFYYFNPVRKSLFSLDWRTALVLTVIFIGAESTFAQNPCGITPCTSHLTIIDLDATTGPNVVPLCSTGTTIQVAGNVEQNQTDCESDIGTRPTCPSSSPAWTVFPSTRKPGSTRVR